MVKALALLLSLLASSTALSVTSVKLVNAINDGALVELTDGATIDLADYPTKSFSFLAETDPEDVGSVVISINGELHIENTAPYEYPGNGGTTLDPGTYSFAVTAYESSDAQGLAGETFALTVTLVDSSPYGVVKFQLIDADTDLPIVEITDGSFLDLSALPPNVHNFNVEAVTEPERVGSVKFFVNNEEVRVENGFPYSLAGDRSGDFNAMELLVGTYTLKGIAYRERDGLGDEGDELAVTVSVVRTGPCIVGDFTVDSNGCQFDALLEGLQGKLDEVPNCARTPLDEIKILTGIEDETILESAVSDMCSAAWVSVEGGFMSYEDILQHSEGRIYTEAFYNGGST